jgi:hypothetical protein
MFTQPGWHNGSHALMVPGTYRAAIRKSTGAGLWQAEDYQEGQVT